MLPLLRSTKALKPQRCLAVSPKRFSHSISDHCDIVIVGGGPAGLALATALGSCRNIQASLRVVLVEASDLSKVKQWSLPEGYSNRVSSITNASRGFLQDIGAWPMVEVSRTGPVEEIQVWDGVSDARITFSASEMLPAQSTVELSRLTENLNLQRALLHRLSSLGAVELVDRVKVQSIIQENTEGSTWPLVHLSDGRVIRTRLLVGADGPNSPVRTYAGIKSYGWAYDTHAIVGTLYHAPRGPYSSPNTTAYQRFLPTGPIAFLPLSETASSLVWSTKPPLAAALKAVDPSVLAAMINAAFRLPEVSMRYLHSRIVEAQERGSPITLDELREEIAFRERSHAIDSHSAYSSLVVQQDTSGIPPEGADGLPPLVTSIQPGTIASFPLRFSHAESYIGEGAGARTVLVGDAAHTTHPLAGQGLNMGLADVRALADCISQAVSRGLDLGKFLHRSTALFSQSLPRESQDACSSGQTTQVVLYHCRACRLGTFSRVRSDQRIGHNQDGSNDVSGKSHTDKRGPVKLGTCCERR
ncbi:unnamed protein product [Somion occarium]|uniref:FAD-binding domain-containing protein n=1 Tax=Somion occarium TaxID=3059160 RepID=A0ABP1E7V8_9APHY